MRELVEAAESLLATRMREFFEILLPESLPEVRPSVIPMA
jgi:ABC-type spermidine/putrescine transport system permease subunit I